MFQNLYPYTRHVFALDTNQIPNYRSSMNIKLPIQEYMPKLVWVYEFNFQWTSVTKIPFVDAANN